MTQQKIVHRNWIARSRDNRKKNFFFISPNLNSDFHYLLYGSRINRTVTNTN